MVGCRLEIRLFDLKDQVPESHSRGNDSSSLGVERL